jgi:hypothetical protein
MVVGLPTEIQSYILTLITLVDMFALYITSQQCKRVVYTHLYYHPTLKLPKITKETDNVNGIMNLLSIPSRLTDIIYEDYINRRYYATPRLISLILRNKNTLRTIGILFERTVNNISQLLWTASQCSSLERICFDNYFESGILKRPSMIHFDALMMMVSKCRKLTELTFDFSTRLLKFRKAHTKCYDIEDHDIEDIAASIVYRVERQLQIENLITSGLCSFFLIFLYIFLSNFLRY